jgi:hypothetical protein
VRRSRLLLLLVALAGLAAALALGAVLIPQQAGANDEDRAASAAKRRALEAAKARASARRMLHAQRMKRTLSGIRNARDKTWRWQDVMLAPRYRYVASAERSPSLRYRRYVMATWTQRAQQVRRSAQHPPRYDAWMCIHKYEGSWTDPNAPYYGGLQMDLMFQQAYGAALLHKKGTADHWTALEQIWVAERAYRSGRGFYPWPNTARWCGLI